VSHVIGGQGQQSGDIDMQLGFFDIDKRHAQLSKHGDPLERLNAVINWEIFRPILEKIDAKARKSNAGRKPLDRVLMFKLLILQRIHNLADERLEFQVTDRLSFMRFLGLEFGDSIPDARTVWAFREELKEHDLIDSLFAKFNEALTGQGVEMKSGQIIDATFIPIPIQRNNREDNKTIKAGKVPANWSQTPNKEAHKDTDARWTKKGGVSHYGYKNHVNVDAATKLVTKWTSTHASVHDSQAFEAVLRTPEEGGSCVSADSAYRSDETQAMLAQKQYDSRIHEKAYRAAPLTDEQKALNKEKSSVRARVEHVFGHMQTSLGGMLIRSIGAARAKLNIGLMNLVYNMSRVEILIRKGLVKITGLGTSKMA
jgi:transposase, IS5 family